VHNASGVKSYTYPFNDFVPEAIIYIHFFNGQTIIEDTATGQLMLCRWKFVPPDPVNLKYRSKGKKVIKKWY
jgi:hypothetical protein